MAAIMAGDRESPMMEPMNMPLYTSDRLRLRSATGTHLQQQQGQQWQQRQQRQQQQQVKEV